MRWNLVELPFNIFERPACKNKKDPHACRPNKTLFPYDAILFGNLNYYFVYLLVTYAIDHTFDGFTGVINHAGCWENKGKACKSRAEGE